MWSRKVLLDEQGESSPGVGYRLVDTDVALLRYALSEDDLHIVGYRLCRWSRAFFSGRPVTIEAARSLAARLREVFPALEPEQAGDLAVALKHRGMGNATEATRFDSKTLLSLVHADFAWHAQPSAQHAASYLLWLLRYQDDPAWRTLVAPLASAWEASTPSPVSASYAARTPDEARDRILDWLGLGSRGQQFPPFPLELPDAELDLRQNLIELSTRTAGRAHENLGSGAPFSAFVLAAESDFRYLEQNPGDLTRGIIHSLEAALPADRVRRLRAMVPQPVPQLAPDGIGEIVRWFNDEYLPFRQQRWLSFRSKLKQDEGIAAVIDDFVPKMLRHYVDGLYGGPAQEFMNHVRMEKMIRSARHDTRRALLVALLDGLTVPDAQIVRCAAEQENGRLQTLRRETAIATIPTITRFAKTSLLAGKPPVMADQSPRVEHYTRVSDARSALRNAGPGDVVVWSTMEPDTTYHRATDTQTAISTVRSHLEGVGRQIAEFANEVDSSIDLEILLCTDHGRLMGVAQRRVTPPQGWSAHGRAAWGRYEERVPACGFEREGDIAYIDAERFGLEYDVAFVWGEEAYLTQDSRGGDEVSPHGGLYPEEVLVPWIVLGRDRGQARVTVEVHGEGRTQQMGDLTIRLSNDGDSPVTAIELLLHVPGREPVALALGVNLAPAQMAEVQSTIDQWPSPEQASHAEGQVLVSYPNGRRQKLDCTVRIASADMYRRDDLLDDLS